MPTWFLVASGNVNASAPFATTSGGAGGAGTPTTGDTIICDGNSGASTLTLNVAISLASLDCQGGTGLFTGTIAHSAAVTLTITGTTNALRFSAGMTYTPAATTSVVTFANLSGTAQITCAGQAFGAITRNGAGGTTQQQDNLFVNGVQNSIFTLTSGTWDCNNKNLTASLTSITGATTRAFTLGTGTVTIGGNASTAQTLWTAATTTGLTFSAASGSFVVLPPATTIFGWSIATGTLSYPAWTLNNTTTSGSVISISSGATFASLTVGSGWSLIFNTVGTTTIATAFTWAGTQASPILVSISVYNTNVTISCPSGACTASWAIFDGITATGGASFTVTNGFVIGGSGIASSNPISPAQVATAVWQDLLASSDFTTAGSAGALLAALQNLQYTVPAMARGTVGASATTTSVPTSAFSPAGAAANQFAGRVILFDATTATAALRGQVATISASSNSATPTLTVSALTTAPASGDTFSVV